jgi:hypothetical protein
VNSDESRAKHFPSETRHLTRARRSARIKTVSNCDAVRTAWILAALNLREDRDPVAHLANINITDPRIRGKKYLNTNFHPVGFVVVPISLNRDDIDLVETRRALHVHNLIRDGSNTDRPIKLPARKGRSHREGPGLGLLLSRVSTDRDVSCSGNGEQSIRFIGSGYDRFNNLFAIGVGGGDCVWSSWFAQA